MSYEPLAWHRQAWRRLRLGGDRLPHAWLLYGVPGVGKRHFARCVAAALLCTDPDVESRACGRCPSCRLTLAGNHPDRLSLSSIDGKAIGVDEMRRVVQFSVLTPHYRRKVIVIEQADDMNRAAANALLKTLEEPPPTVHLLLVAEQASRLAPTVVSRCVKVRFAVPPRAQALEYLRTRSIANAEPLLALANGAPLAALALAERDVLTARRRLFDAWLDFVERGASLSSVAEALRDCDGRELIDHVQSWLTDMVQLHMVSRSQEIANDDLREPLQTLAYRCVPRRVLLTLDKLYELKRIVSGHVALNKQLLLEQILMLCREGVRSTQA